MGTFKKSSNLILLYVIFAKLQHHYINKCDDVTPSHMCTKTQIFCLLNADTFVNLFIYSVKYLRVTEC